MRYIYEGGCLQNGRPTNMDSLLLRERRINGQSALIAIVCDGVGSTKDGAYASSTAVSLLNQWFSSAVTCERLGLRLRDKVIEINAQIAGIGKRDGLDTASTLSLVALVEDKYYIVHIGDSRIYSIGNGSVSMLTHDDVSETGKLSGYIGRAPDINLFYDEGEATGKAFAICSDGFYKRMDFSLLTKEIANLKSKSDIKHAIGRLTAIAVERGETDNISIAIIKSEF